MFSEVKKTHNSQVHVHYYMRHNCNCWDNQMNLMRYIPLASYSTHYYDFFFHYSIRRHTKERNRKMCSLSYIQGKLIHKNINLLYSFCQACMSCTIQNAQGSSLTTSVFFLPEKKINLKQKITRGSEQGRAASISVK